MFTCFHKVLIHKRLCVVEVEMENKMWFTELLIILLNIYWLHIDSLAKQKGNTLGVFKGSYVLFSPAVLSLQWARPFRKTCRSLQEGGEFSVCICFQEHQWKLKKTKNRKQEKVCGKKRVKIEKKLIRVRQEDE